jgi:hypothetical protein
MTGDPCVICGDPLPNEMSPLAKRCNKPECIREHNRQRKHEWEVNNRERVREYHQEYDRRNRERNNELHRQYYAAKQNKTPEQIETNRKRNCEIQQERRRRCTSGEADRPAALQTDVHGKKHFQKSYAVMVLAMDCEPQYISQSEFTDYEKAYQKEPGICVIVDGAVRINSTGMPAEDVAALYQIRLGNVQPQLMEV